ncbi:MAG: hypothetical protein EHM72_15275 [Calditrichaeota bacterium]|nr:MAG: hypothetical protein EHM72_15275 [Calditrichota bacterium]
MKIQLICGIVLCLLTVILYAGGEPTQISTDANYRSWGWNSVVMKNGVISVATMPEIGARIMEYNLGEHPFLFVNPSELGKTHTPNQSQWYNYGGYKVWPAPQAVWNWPPPAILDAGPWTAQIIDNTQDSVSVFVASQKETWNKTPNLSMERRTVIYRGSSRVKIEQSIINEGAKTVNWSVWDVSQCIVNHPNEKDFENFWIYFPIKTEDSVFGDQGVKTSDNFKSKAWKGEVAPGIYGVNFRPDNVKIFADSPEGWIAYVDEREGFAYVKVFDIFEGQDYPDDGARNEVWVQGSPYYCEVEVVSPIWPISAGGKITFVENWYASKANGPVLAVNHVGLVETHLAFDPVTGHLYGLYGIFHEGFANISFLNASESMVGESSDFPVSPLQKLEIDQVISVPETAVSALVNIYDPSGDFIGTVDRVPAANLTRVFQNKPPKQFALKQNFPNPFNPTTTIECVIEKFDHVRLSLVNITGAEVATLVDDWMSPGSHQIIWNGSNYPAGIYTVRLESSSRESDLIKIVLLK